jgi:hypothetical protein
MLGTNKKMFFVGFVIMPIFILVAYLITIREEKKLKKNKILTSCIVISITNYPRADGLWVTYQFQINEAVKRKRARVFVRQKYKEELSQILSNRRWPVVYDSTNYGNNEILLNRKDYRIYEVRIPDTLLPLIKIIDSLSFGNAGKG